MMKFRFKILFIIIFSIIALSSCRKEEMVVITPDVEEALGSEVANLLLRTATNDGSYDNILDSASCFNIKLPVTVIVNGTEVIIENQDDLQTVEDIFDEFPNDVDTLEFQFPITIVKSDYSEEIINSQAELNAAAAQCVVGNDDDIECIDIQYPITASVFNLNNELLETVVIQSDAALFAFLQSIDPNTIVTFDFPITVILYDESTIEIENFVQLADIIANADDVCDEDDDNDPYDDDCDNCSTQQLSDLLTGCDNWFVDKLERNDDDLEDTYIGYFFSFDPSGTITIQSGSDIYYGNWSATGTGNNIDVVINIPTLPDFNNTWNLHEIEQQPGESKVDLRLGDDRLRFESDCGTGGSVDDTILVNALTTGDWYVTYYFDDTDETSDYADYTFNFVNDNTATATHTSGTTNGFWSTAAGDETALELNLNFGTLDPLDELADDWDVLEVTNDIIRLKDRSGGDGSVDFLTFERTQAGGGGSMLADILADGLWFVQLYTDDGYDETIYYYNYNIDFNISGTVVATNGSNTNSGTWQALNSDTELNLYFVGAPFDEFNDDWDVLMFTNTRVELQDVSGGGGGTDILILEKL